MVLTFQGWRFQRWRQASLWTVKKIRRQRIRGITRRRSESNARGACRIIGDNSTSRTIESHGNDSKTRKLGALWTETERRWKAIFHLRTADSKTTEKRFFGLWLEIRSGYSTTTPRRKNTTLSQSLSSISTSTPRPNIHSSKIMLCIWWNQRVLFTMSCWNLAFPLRAIGIGYNWFVWAVHYEKSAGIRAKTW